MKTFILKDGEVVETTEKKTILVEKATMYYNKLYCTVVDDPWGRFRKGVKIRTSSIVKKIDDSTYETKNNIYKIVDM